MKKSLICLLLIAVCVLSACGSTADGSASGGYDLDLTKLSSTVVYSEVYNMMTEPAPYVGQQVKMQGEFAVYEGEGRNYYACIISDATACCAQGIEFVLDDDLRYPEDYPPVGTIITVTGEFETYDENGIEYCQLKDAQIIR